MNAEASICFDQELLMTVIGFSSVILIVFTFLLLAHIKCVRATKKKERNNRLRELSALLDLQIRDAESELN